jgi:hypothetical protein
VPITAYLELWEAGPKGPCQRGNRLVSRLGLIDTSPNAPADFISYLYTSMANLVLIVACITRLSRGGCSPHVTDLLPTSYRARIPRFDATIYEDRGPHSSKVSSSSISHP